MSARDDYPKIANIIRGGPPDSELAKAIDEIERLRNILDHYRGWFGTDCRCDGDDGKCPISGAGAA